MEQASQSRKAALLIGSLGVVYGDIGTSPLYALRECFNGEHGVVATAAHAFGVVSLIIWTLTIIVSIKYLVFVMRANNNGEGGILALLALAQRGREGESGTGKRFEMLIILGVFGAALLYGDGIITPAITVLGAVEGLQVAMPVFKPYVVPLTVAILVALFSFQKHGTGRIGIVFGPVMLVWFVVMGCLGVGSILKTPQILGAISPHHAVLFLAHNTGAAFVVLGSVFLVVTGAEALYADMGHFGVSPIRRAWFGIAFPALVLNYFGQGALVLRSPEAAANPFFLLAPSWGVVGLSILATFAAVIASQALISGVFSLTMQAIQMGLLPRMSIRHTSQAAFGQIYMPHVNWLLMTACVGLVLSFQSSSRIASAYGIAVSLTMLIDTMLFFAAARRVWKWPVWLAILVTCGFFLLEASFITANGVKILQGGWFPLVIGACLSFLMLTWRAGRSILRRRLANSFIPLETFLKDMEDNPPQRVRGTAVFLSGNPNGTPIALLHNLKHNKVLHERVIILTITTSNVPYVPESERLVVQEIQPDFFRVVGKYGFMEQPDIPRLLLAAKSHKLPFEMFKSTFFLSRETIVSGKARDMALWRQWVFSTLSRNAQAATAFFNLPANRVVELGLQVGL